jgi:hypothetical protein
MYTKQSVVATLVQQKLAVYSEYERLAIMV